MNILQVCRQFYPSVGGIETAVWHLSRHLRAAGHQVRVITLNRLFKQPGERLPAEAVVDEIPVTRLPYWGSPRYALAPAVLRCAPEGDVIHLHSSDFFLDFLALTRPLHRKPLVLSSHGLFFHTPFAPALKRMYFHTVTRLSVRQLQAAICDSRPDMEWLRRLLPADRLHLIPNGIEAAKWSALDGMPRDPDLVISVGRLAVNKRHDRLLRAFAALIQRRPTTRLVILGPDDGLCASLQQLSGELGLGERVEFRGRVPDEELGAYLGRASLWVSASGYEGFGIALLEAMAAGCLPVAHPLPTFQEFMVEGQSGFYADFDQPAQAAEVMLKALALPRAEREALAAAAKATAGRFAWPNIARQVQDVYAQVLATS